MARYLTNTFSPMMLSRGTKAVVVEATLEEVRGAVETGLISAVSHAGTAEVLSVLLGTEVVFNRVNLVLRDGDEVWCVIPSFRAEVAREFTRDEIEAAGFRCFRVVIVTQSTDWVDFGLPPLGRQIELNGGEGR